MRRSMLVAAVLVALALPVTAGAQAPVTGDFGGGGVLPPPASPFSAGNMVIGLSFTDGTSVQFSATIVASCASGTFTATASVAADGTFSVTGDVRQARTRTRYELSGTLSERPSGIAAARFDRATARGTRTCSATGVTWEARRPVAGFGEPAQVAPGATLLGPTSQRQAGAPRGIVLQIASDGRSVGRALYGVTLRCSGDYSSPTFDLPRADLPILPDGRVSDREDGTQRTASTILRYTERFAATLGSGGAQGMFSVTLSLRRRATGKRIATCRSGSVRWSASA